jgi:hypothetical protein
VDYSQRTLVCLTVSGALCVLFGCADEDPITSYLASHSPSAHTASKGKQALLGAIVPYRGQGWFFKAVGPPDLVEPEHERFRQFVRSLRFADGDKEAAPTWTAPDGWTLLPGSGIRYATFTFGPADSPVELSVIGLPTPDVMDDAYILRNVNRWRHEVQLIPISTDQLALDAEIIPLNGTEATLVRMRGEGSGTTSGDGRQRPAADGLVSPHQSMTRSTGILSSQQPSELKFTVPNGWTVAPASGMRKAVFTVTHQGQSVEITVIDLVAESGEWLPNVNRWRGQIQLGETTAEELASVTKKISAGDAVGDYVALVGPADASRPQTILAAVVLHGGKSWFVKLIGDSDLAAREEERFKSFVHSLQF